MLPNLTQHNSTDKRCGNAELSGESAFRAVAFVCALTNLLNNFIRQLGRAVTFAAPNNLRVKVRRVSITSPELFGMCTRATSITYCSVALFVPVMVVISMCSKEQVSWVTASCVIARMAYAQATGVFAVVEKVCDAVREQFYAIVVFLSDDGSVTACAGCGTPRPALITGKFTHLFPKTVGLSLCEIRNGIIGFSHDVRVSLTSFTDVVVRPVWKLAASARVASISSYYNTLAGGMNHAYLS